MLDDNRPSLVNLPPEIILHIIRFLPQSPYNKCLNVCQRLSAIESDYIVKRTTMCLCRVHEDSPNLPSEELKLFLCRKVSSSNLDILIELIRRRPLTCKTTVYGRVENIDMWDDYFPRHRRDNHLTNFIRNCETFISDGLSYGFSSSLFPGLDGHPSSYRSEFITDSLNMTLGENHDTIQQFCKSLINSCFHRVTMHCNNRNYQLFNDCLKMYLHISDILHFQAAVENLTWNQMIATPFPSNFLTDFDNLNQLSLVINEEDCEHLKNRLSELIQALKQANLRHLEYFGFKENSPIECLPYVMPLWIDLLDAIPSNKLKSLRIERKSVESRNGIDALSNGLLLAEGIARFTLLQFLTIHHWGFDSTVLTKLSSLPQLVLIDLRINMNISMDESSFDFESCNRLYTINLRFSMVTPTIFDKLFGSIAKVRQRIVIKLHFDSLEYLPTCESFENFKSMENLQQITIYIGKTNASMTTTKELYNQIEDKVHQNCKVWIEYKDE